ncbi:MAG: phosphoenolpyruvate carboxykinase (ATP) [Sphingobacteriales bacterium]|nr:MAG: phosphoenolpyruvate carboxykinase (ATP) [Sphingobacteriales bacterium]
MTVVTDVEQQTIIDSIKAKGNNRLHWNLSPAELVEQAILHGEGKLADNGALAADTGKFTGRSPKDKFIVADEITENSVWWGDINIKFDSQKFDKLYDKVIDHLANKELYIRDSYACAMPEYKLNVRVVTESAYQNLFAYNLFLRPTADELQTYSPEWHVIAAPSFEANPEVDGTRQANFAIVNFTKKIILIGGTGYTGEIKKGIFSVLNFVLPHQHNVLSMHCSANIGKEGDTAIFFGLSGTGKTTLSSDPERKLIGDDEHGWTEGNVFNFEGGCYAKVINLSAMHEPQIYNAIKFGALLENINFIEGTRQPDYEDSSKTENTRAAYPIYHIDNVVEPSVGTTPKNIFFLTADAFGVLPPISRLTKEQAMFYFISGYTAKVAGTEAGVLEPSPTFSACFGQVFLPLHPTKYAEMLGAKLDESNAKVWLINTGWTGGSYGVGKRMSLPHTRAMINAALNGELDKVEFVKDPVFGLEVPLSCPSVPSEILIPRNTWADTNAFDAKAKELAGFFNKNFEKYANFANDDIKQAAPKVN